MVVIGHETHSPVVTLAVVYNSGARHESDADIGLTHCLRMAVTQVLVTKELFLSHNIIVLCCVLFFFILCTIHNSVLAMQINEFIFNCGDIKRLYCCCTQ